MATSNPENESALFRFRIATPALNRFALYRFAPCFLGVVPLLPLLLGCGSDTSSSQRTNVSASPTADTSELRRIAASGLPIGDYLPPLDGGRVEICIPKNWSPLPRDSKYVARFYKEDQNSLPRIEVSAEDKTYGEISTATVSNVVAFATAVDAELKGKKLIEPVLPMVIGSTPCARYVMKIELKMPQGSIVAERQTLVTLHNGRAYTIHLLVLPNTLITHRDAAYAICAGLKFPSPLQVGESK